MAEKGTPRPRWASWRTTLQTIGLVVGVLLLLWGADALARLGAQSLLQRNIQDVTGIAQPPVVELGGAFFLPQVIRGAYEEVHVGTRGISSGPLRLEQVDSRLFDVRVPFHDVLVRDFRRVGIGRSVQDLTLTYADLNNYFHATGRDLTVTLGPNDTVQVNGTVTVLGKSFHAIADVLISGGEGVLRITPQRIDAGSPGLDTASRLLLRQRFNLTVPLGNLPFGHRLTKVTATPNGFQITAVGAGVILQP